ncbi:hypothetical protein [Streptomyces sp. A012304]|uniref:hypothetical protein n=1 Tax=Streptomyces sp. A012304 TaxID=375446 RepID=UPI00222F59EA|nr:hypothetical protein [Streptomyces sp. A012304]
MGDPTRRATDERLPPLTVTGVQAARILTALAGSPRIPRPWEGASARPAKEK